MSDKPIEARIDRFVNMLEGHKLEQDSLAGKAKENYDEAMERYHEGRASCVGMMIRMLRTIIEGKEWYD